jgi:Phasin protein
MDDNTQFEQTATQAANSASDAARDYALQAAGRVQEGAKAAHEKAQQATAAVESFVTGAVTEIAKITREAQGAWLDDAKAAIEAFTNVARAKSLAEAAQIQIDYFGNRSRVNVERAKSVATFVKSKFGEGYTKWASVAEKAA